MELVTKADRKVVLIGTPAYDKSVSMDYAASLIATSAELVKHGMGCGVHIIGGMQFVDLARNQIVDYFLKAPEGFTDLLFMDADQGWDAKAIPRLIRYSQSVVAALPPKKTEKPSFHSGAITGVIADGLFQSLEAGTGCMRIKREVFAAMDKAFPDLQTMKHEISDATPYFQAGYTKYGWRGEDIFFCNQLLAMGEHVWIDSDITFSHHGNRVWRGNFYEHAVETGLLLTEKTA